MPGDMKSKIAHTLTEILKHKELDKITVKELVDTCHISRQTFYYHFQDLMEVIEWCQEQNLQHSIEKSLQAPTYQEALQGIVEELWQNKDLISQLMASRQRKKMESLFVQAMRIYLRELFFGKGSSSISLSSKDMDTLLSFYSFGLVGMMLSGLRQRDMDLEEWTGQMYRLLAGEIAPPLIAQDGSKL